MSVVVLTERLIQSIFPSMKIEDVIKQNESKTLEFKQNIDAKARLLATVIAFSNTAGGKLIIGVDDKTHNIVGIKDPHSIEEKLANLISDSIEPKVVPNIEIIPWRDTYVIVLEVYPGASRPYYLKNRTIDTSTYIRVGSTNRLADRSLINSIKRSLLIKTFDEEALHEVNYEEIDFRVASEYFEPFTALKTSDYYSLDLLVKENASIYPSVGGILLFGKNRLKHFPDSWIQAACFDGRDKSRIVDHQDIKVNLIDSVDHAINFIRKHLFIGMPISSIRNVESWSVPKIAIREALINSIVHADYSVNGAPIRISIFDDRIEIENPGLLAIGITIEDIIAGISKIRNRVITRVFHKLRLIEHWGSGVQRIIASCQELGLKTPKFEEIGNRFRVILYKEKVKPILLDSVESKIIEAIRTKGALSTKEIAMHVGFTTRNVRNRLIKMIEKKQIVEIAKNANDPKKKYDIG